jgi:peptidoglycan/xylan/chitin deacetylase (PgdA/CDA1 family)
MTVDWTTTSAPKACSRSCGASIRSIAKGATARQIVQTVRKGLSPGDIIILHDNRSTTETALPKIIAMINERGLTPVTVPELLAQDPPTRGQLRHHTCN